MSEYWDEKNETMPIEEREAIQLKALQGILKWTYERIPFYRNAFDAKGLKPEDLQSFADLSNYPTTVKNDLRDNYPFGLCAVPIEKVVRIHASSGTTGKPVTGPYTAQDLEDWTECMARNLWAAGLRQDDIC